MNKFLLALACLGASLSLPAAHAQSASMAAQGVAFATQNRLLARLAPMHREIVNVH